MKTLYYYQTQMQADAIKGGLYTNIKHTLTQADAIRETLY